MPLKKAMMNMLHKLHLDGEDLHKKGYLQGESLEQWKREISEIEENGSLSPRNGDNPFGTMPNIEVDTATKRWYNWDTKSWETAKISVRVSPEPFTTGSERAVHAMLLVPPNAEEQQCVAKRMREAKADVQGKYENDVIRQAECQHIAEAFNKLEPAKKVYFLDTYMMHHKGSWWTVEKYLTGRMISHNDAHGFVEPMQRNTPQAFSHYSHHYSEGKFIIVGIKGVGDVYTNPQIHTKNGQGFGFGNLGPAGIQQFFQTHICNQICEKLGLKSYMALGTGVNNIKRTGTECPKGTVQEKLGIMEYIGDVQPRAGTRGGGWAGPVSGVSASALGNLRHASPDAAQKWIRFTRALAAECGLPCDPAALKYHQPSRGAPL